MMHVDVIHSKNVFLNLLALCLSALFPGFINLYPRAPSFDVPEFWIVLTIWPLSFDTVWKMIFFILKFRCLSFFVQVPMLRKIHTITIYSHKYRNNELSGVSRRIKCTFIKCSMFDFNEVLCNKYPPSKKIPNILLDLLSLL